MFERLRPTRRRWTRTAVVLTVAVAAATAVPAEAGVAPALPRPPGGASHDPAAVVGARYGLSRDAAARMLRTEHTQAALAQRLVSTLGEARTAGAYLNDGTLVVTVTDAGAAATVSRAGGQSRRVTRSQKQLARIQSVLEAAPSAPGTTWGVDAETDQVVVTLPASGTANAGQLAAAGRQGGAVRVETASGTITTTAGDVAGGDAIFGTGGCSAGFTVTDGGFNYVLTAGRCTAGFPRWRIAKAPTWDRPCRATFPAPTTA